MWIDGLPVTSVARTLLDLQDVLPTHRLERVVHRAEQLRVLDAAALAASPGRRAAPLRAALATLAVAEPQITRSELEERFLELVAEAGLPAPEVNARLLGYEVDFLWRDARLIAECDGRETHFTEAAFESDRERDAALQVAGFRTVRFTWRQVTNGRERVADTLAALLDR